MENPLLFASVVLAVLGMPGPTNTLLATAGAADGFRRSSFLIAAVAFGYFIAVETLRITLGPLLGNAPILIGTLRVLVGAYLLYVAWHLWSRSRVPKSGEQKTITTGQVFLTTLLNPKAIVFAFGIIPIGVANISVYLLAFVVFAAIVSALWLAAGVLLGQLASDQAGNGVVSRVGAVVLGAFAVTLVASPLLH